MSRGLLKGTYLANSKIINLCKLSRSFPSIYIPLIHLSLFFPWKENIFPGNAFILRRKKHIKLSKVKTVVWNIES